MNPVRDGDEIEEEETDSDDVDFVPEAPESDLSEEDDNDDKTENGEKAGGRKRRKGTKGKKRRKRRRRGEESDEGSSDDEYFTPELSDNTELNGHGTKELDEEEEKRRTDKLYSEFLSGVEEISKRRKSGAEEAAATTSVKKVYDFAGEKVVVEEKVASKSVNGVVKHPSTENSSSSSSSLSVKNNGDKPAVPAGAKGSGPPFKSRVSILSGNPSQIGLGSQSGGKQGLAAVLNAIKSKKQKMGTLEKSRLDWQAFKKDEGIEEELQKHTKSKDGFLERQEFLQRADVRQFEIEKGLRARQRRNV